MFQQDSKRQSPPRLSSGQRLALYSQLLPLAHAHAVDELGNLLIEAHDHDTRTHALDLRWANLHHHVRRLPGVYLFDIQVDTLLGRIRSVVAGHLDEMELSRQGDEPFERLSSMLAELFPAGMFTVTQLSYTDRVAAVEIILPKLRGTFADLVIALKLTRKVTELAELARDYRLAVDTNTRLEFAELRRARRRGSAYLGQIIQLIDSAYPDNADPLQRAARDELLAPIFAQANAARARRRISLATAGAPRPLIAAAPATAL
ncbi:MAG: hypothetical protein AAGC55_06805, partial [Myxococcota bacterium]